MQFAVIAYDFTDRDAYGRRLAARGEHLALGDRMKGEGKLLFAAALQDDEMQKMIGSVLICDFPARADLDAWLRVEPYVVQKVWEKIEVRQCKVGPAFVK